MSTKVRGSNTQKRKILSAAEILAADDLITETVQCDEWGGDVLIKSMTGTERDAFEVAMTKKDEKGNIVAGTLDNVRAGLVAATAVDAEGVQLFTIDQVEALGKKSALALDRCFDVASRLNRMYSAAVAEEKGNS